MSEPLVILTGDASRTGSPRMLLSFLEWVRVTYPTTPVHLVLSGDGPLLESFQSVATSTTLLDGGLPGHAELLALAMEELGRPALAARVRTAATKRRLRSLPKRSIVLANGAGALRLLDAVPAPRWVVGWVHEMAVGLDRSLAGTDTAALLRRPDRLLAVSESVAAELLARHVRKDRIRLVYGWVPEPSPRRDRTALRAELGLAPTTLLVGGCGTSGWRKGTDLFLAVAQRLDPSTHLVWIGRDPTASRQLRREVAARGLSDRVHLLGERDDAPAVMAGLDVFALTSREDAFPLVALEAASAGVPVVSFRSGGVSELLSVTGLNHLLVPYLDVSALASGIQSLLDDPAGRAAGGLRLAEQVAAHHTAQVGAPVVWEALQTCPG